MVTPGDSMSTESERARHTHSKLLSYLTGARYVHPLSVLAKVSRTRSTVSADVPGRLVPFTAHRQSLCWNFMCHSRIVLSVGGSLCYMVRNLRCTVTTDSLLANYKTKNGFLSPVHVILRHDCALAVKPASTPWRLLPKLGQILYLLICFFLLCLSWLLRSRVRNFWRGLTNYPVLYRYCDKLVNSTVIFFKCRRVFM
jgi:hypothetical protein